MYIIFLHTQRRVTSQDASTHYHGPQTSLTTAHCCPAPLLGNGWCCWMLLVMLLLILWTSPNIPPISLPSHSTRSLGIPLVSVHYWSVLTSAGCYSRGTLVEAPLLLPLLGVAFTDHALSFMKGKQIVLRSLVSNLLG